MFNWANAYVHVGLLWSFVMHDRQQEAAHISPLCFSGPTYPRKTIRDFIVADSHYAQPLA